MLDTTRIEAKPDAKIIERIRKLFALSRSPNEAEASAALEKAHTMLRDYNLEMIDLKEPSEIVDEVIEEGRRETRWRNLLLIRTAEANYCVLITQRWAGCYKYKLYGRPANIKGAMLVYEYLCEVIEREAKKAAKRIEGLSRAEFAQGMAMRLGQRLLDMREVDVSECTALVPVAGEAEQFVKATIEDLKERATKVDYSPSRNMGYRAAETVSLARQMEAPHA